MTCILPDGIDLEWSHCRQLSNEQPKYIICKMCRLKSKIKTYLVARLDIQVAEFDLKKVGRVLHIEEVVPAETHGHPGGDHRQHVLQHGPVERQGQAEMIDMNVFYGLIVNLIFQQFLWRLVTLDSGNMAERIRCLPQKHWG